MFNCSDDTDHPDIVPWHREETGPTRLARPAGDRRGLTTGVGRLIGRGCMTSPIPHRSQPALRSGRSPRRGQRPWPTRGEHINNRCNCRQAGVDQSVRGRVSGWVRAESRCHVVSEPHSDTQELRSEQPVVKCIWVGHDPLVGFHQRTQLGD